MCDEDLDVAKNAGRQRLRTQSALRYLFFALLYLLLLGTALVFYDRLCGGERRALIPRRQSRASVAQAEVRDGSYQTAEAATAHAPRRPPPPAGGARAVSLQ